ncbi:DUF5009 domain-containing protein [Flavisolibacter sp. BT320]|nr:DUF5009 domain-containing protein [Flavisolibacter longurius]
MPLTKPIRKAITLASTNGAPFPSNTDRVSSIDSLRALTMLLMIFVNDLWSLQNIPLWLEHVPADADGMGLADTVFPAFLFIVGMSIPLAIAARRKKGDSQLQLLQHILVRTMALLVMGLFLVNGENINAAATGISRALWNTLSCTSFILIWNVYPKNMQQTLKRILRGIGIANLLTLAFLYKGGEDGNLTGFSTWWWGILGLIGWCYFTASVITAFAGKQKFLIVGPWLVFVTLSLFSTAGLLPQGSLLSVIPSPIIGGTLVALTLGGVLTTMLFQHFQKSGAQRKVMVVLFLISLALIGLGLVTNRFWDISKIRATAPWLFLCSGLTVLGFMLVHWLISSKRKARWFALIKPAGTHTLLCYLIPYFAYALFSVTGFSLPDMLTTGLTGLVKSFAFALLCIWVTGLLVRKGIALKV